MIDLEMTTFIRYVNGYFLRWMELRFSSFKTILHTSSLGSMFALFKKKSEKEKLQERYKKLIEESYKLSHINRAASDQIAAEAEELYKRIEDLKKKEDVT